MNFCKNKFCEMWARSVAERNRSYWAALLRSCRWEQWLWGPDRTGCIPGAAAVDSFWL